MSGWTVPGLGGGERGLGHLREFLRVTNADTVLQGYACTTSVTASCHHSSVVECMFGDDQERVKSPEVV